MTTLKLPTHFAQKEQPNPEYEHQDIEVHANNVEITSCWKIVPKNTEMSNEIVH